MMTKETSNETFLWENQAWYSSILDNLNDSNLEISREKASPPPNCDIPKAIEIMSDQTLDLDSSKNEKRSRHKGGAGGDEIEKGDKVKRDHESDHEMHVWTERERRKKMRNMFDTLQEFLPQLPPKTDKATIVTEAAEYIKSLQQTLENLEKQKLQKLQNPETFAFEPSSSSSAIITPQMAPAAPNSNIAFPAEFQSGSSHNYARNDNNNQALSHSTIINSSALSELALASGSNPNANMYPMGFQTWTSSNVVLNVCGDVAHINVCLENNKPPILTTICSVLEKHKIDVVSAQVSSTANRRMYMIQAQVKKGAYDWSTEGFQVAEIYREAANELLFWISS